MRVVKPAKVPILSRVVTVARRPRLHVAAMIAFPLDAPRALLDEMAFWAAVTPELGAAPLDEGVSKARGELLVAGRCHPPGGKAVGASYVRVRLGAIDKRLSVVGDRHWTSDGFTDPVPFTAMPIDWAHALGGPGHGPNPYGKGLVDVEVEGRRVRPLPNVERWGALVRSPGERPAPAGLGPMDVTFAERRARAGTIDAAYAARFAPGLPPDASPELFQVAPADQIAAGFFQGDEAFAVENMHPERAVIEGRLPGLLTRALVGRRGEAPGALADVPLRCDTVWLFPSANVGAVVWHGALDVADDDAADVRDLVVACEDPAHPRAVEHYRGALLRRMDKDKAAIASLSDADLMPPREVGVAPNVELAMMRWVASEGLAMKRGQAGAARAEERRRAALAEAGIDPGPTPATPTFEPPPLHDLDALATYVEASLATLEAEAARASGGATPPAAPDPEELAALEGLLDGDPARPPSFTARAELARLAGDAAAMRAAGRPDEALEADLADPLFRAQIERQEAIIRDAYRKGAHFLPAARPMTAEAAGMARVVVDLARTTGDPLGGVDLTGADLAGVDLSGLDLARGLLAGADLRGAKLAGAKLAGAVLAKADLRDADLRGADLRGANLGGAALDGACLDGADLTEAVLTAARVAGARLAGATLERADVIDVRWDGVDLAGARLAGCAFLHASFVGARLAGADLGRATFIECTLDDADLEGADLRRAGLFSCSAARARLGRAQASELVALHGSDLSGADLRGATLERACLRGTRLRGAQLEGARMTMADLSECDATGARLDRAVLTGTLLVRTTLDGASLRGANLAEAIVSKATVPGADFGGAQLFRADLSGARGDAATSFAGAHTAWVRFDERPEGGAS